MANNNEIVEGDIIEFDDGTRYGVETILAVEGKRYAVLVPVVQSDDPEATGLFVFDDEEDAFIGRIEADENGEEVIVDPDDDEYEQVVEAYHELLDSIEENQGDDADKKH